MADVVGTVTWAWNQTKKTPVGQIDDQLKRWFTSDPSTWTTGTEKVAVSTIISSLAVLAGSGFPLILVPFLMPIVAAIADVAVDKIGDFLGLARGTYCDHPEWRTQHMDDPLWIHYPGRIGAPAKGNEGYSNGFLYGAVEHPGWGRLGLKSVTPDVRDYPWIQSLATGIGPDLPSLAVLKIPAAQPGSFEDFWYRVYSKVKETNALQDCIRMSPGDADKQDEAALIAFVSVWNANHDSGVHDTVFPGNAAPGDDLLLAKHDAPITIRRGAFRASGVTARLPNGGLASSQSGLSTGAKVAIAAPVVAAAGVGIYAFLARIAYREAVDRVYKKVLQHPWQAAKRRLS